MWLRRVSEGGLDRQKLGVDRYELRHYYVEVTDESELGIYLLRNI